MDTWTQYWPLYERLESDVCELTFSIALSDEHKDVYSSRTAELLLRLGAESENAAKELCDQRGLRTDADNFPALGKALSEALHLHLRKLPITWPYVLLTNREIVPFDGWGDGTANPAWFTAYNKAKHDRKNHYRVANYWNVILGLGGLLVLNIWLRNPVLDTGLVFHPGHQRIGFADLSRFFSCEFLFVEDEGLNQGKWILVENPPR